MATADRVTHEPAYILHHYDWSESSVIVEAFTRDWGRVALVAKGAKRPSSYFRSVLLPLQPLDIAWGGRGEIRTLKKAEWAGGRVMPTGDALLSGYYVNELVLRLLAREDVHADLFTAYDRTVDVLAAGGEAGRIAVALRGFELILLRGLGVLPALDQETFTLAPLQPAASYGLAAESGVHALAAGDAAGLAGATWCALEQALGAEHAFAAVLSVVGGLPAAERTGLRGLLRAFLDVQCGERPLRTRELAGELLRFRAAARAAGGTRRG